MTKRVLVSGCSFSDPHFVSTIKREWRYDYPMWYDYVAEHYDWRITKNVSVSGTSNDRITSYAMTELLTNPNHYELVMIELTGWTRYYVPTLGLTHNPGIWPTRHHRDGWEGTPDEISIFNVLANTRPESLQKSFVFNHNLDSIFQLVRLCQEMGKELVMFSLYEPKATRGEVSYMLQRHPKFLPITKVNERDETINILGWPFMPKLNGKSLESVDYEEIAPEIGECHPSRKGMITIGVTIIEWLDQGKN